MYIPVKCALCEKEADQDDYERSLFGQLVCISCYNTFKELKRVASLRSGDFASCLKAERIYLHAYDKLRSEYNFDCLFKYAEEKWKVV